MTNVAMEEARFDFGRVVGQTFGLIGRNFVLFFMLALLFAGIPQFAIAYLRVASSTLLDPSFAGSVPLITMLVSLITTFVLQGALTRASVDDLSGKGVTLGAALGDGLRFFFPLLIVGILVTLGIGIGLVLLVIPGIILAVRWAVAAPAVVVEREGPTSAIGRSAELSAGHRWAIFGLALLYVVFVIAVSALLEFGLASAGVTLGEDGLVGTMDTIGIAAAAASAAVDALTALVSTVGAASLYFELRRVKEGVSITDLASVFE